jgi:hypothetical protein
MMVAVCAIKTLGLGQIGFRNTGFNSKFSIGNFLLVKGRVAVDRTTIAKALGAVVMSGQRLPFWGLDAQQPRWHCMH